MKRAELHALTDILDAIEQVSEIVEGCDLAAYRRDFRVYRVVERCVEVVSEAHPPHFGGDQVEISGNSLGGDRGDRKQARPRVPPHRPGDHVANCDPLSAGIACRGCDPAGAWRRRVASSCTGQRRRENKFPARRRLFRSTGKSGFPGVEHSTGRTPRSALPSVSSHGKKQCGERIRDAR